MCSGGVFQIGVSGVVKRNDQTGLAVEHTEFEEVISAEFE
jgi:hypothetical protein